MHRAAGWPYCREANGCVSRVFLPPIARVEEYVYPPARHRRHSPATRAGVINVIEGEAGSIARADVADFCIDAILEKDFPYCARVETSCWVRADGVGSRRYIQKTPCISSVGGTSWVKDRSAAAREGMTA